MGKGDWQEERLAVLETRNKNRSAKRLNKKVEDDCNKKLRSLNCKIQGVANPEDQKAGPLS